MGLSVRSADSNCSPEGTPQVPKDLMKTPPSQPKYISRMPGPWAKRPPLRPTESAHTFVLSD